MLINPASRGCLCAGAALLAALAGSVAAQQPVAGALPPGATSTPASPASAAATAALPRQNSEKYISLHAWTVGDDPAALEAWVDKHLASAQTDIDSIESQTYARTLANTIRPYDDASAELTLAYSETYQLSAVYPDATMRDKAQALAQKISGLLTALSLNERVYHALKSVPSDGLDAPTRYLVERSLLEFHLSGVDRDDVTRAKVQELQDRISGSSADFHKNIAEDLRQIAVPRAEQEGLPPDFVAHHNVDARGNLIITTDDADVTPVLSFAANADLRQRVFTAYHQRGFPANRAVLGDLLKERNQLALLLGYRNFAELDLADQMINSTTRLTSFIDDVDAATRDPAAHEYRRLLKFAKSRHPFLRSISEADLAYWIEQYRRSMLPPDIPSLASYFPYDEVQGGVLKTSARLFHVEFRPITGLNLWDASVSAYAVLDHGKKIGTIYLDMHPRDGKNGGCSSAPLVPGMRGRQLPEGMLLCNFPSPGTADGDLLHYDQVTQLFHEFAHLMHHILGGQGVWSQQESFNSEVDFVEAPSLMMEEFMRDPQVLQIFAHRIDSDENIPAELVEKINAAASFGRAMAWRRQLLYANYTLQLHQLDPATIDADQLYRTDLARFTLTEPVEGLHLYAAFTHIPDYGAKYYSYVLDEVIAIDFYAQFDRSDLLDGATAQKYRRAVLEPGSSKPAEQLVIDFLGRRENVDAFKDWLKGELQP